MNDLELRAQRKAKKPAFIRQNADHKKEVGTTYRKPKGYQSKLRLGKSPRGLKLPSQGYRAPKSVRGTNPRGLFDVIVTSVKDLSNIDAKTQSVVIGSSVGRKQRITLLEKIIELQLPIAIDAKATLATLQEEFDSQKQSRKVKEDKRAAVEAKAKDADKKPAKAAKAEKPAKKTEATEKKDSEKKDTNKDKKILTKKETAM